MFFLIIFFLSGFLIAEEESKLKPGVNLQIDVSYLPNELAVFNGEKLLAAEFFPSVANILNPLSKQKVSRAEIIRIIISLIDEKYNRLVSLELASLSGVEPNIGLSFLELQNMEKELGRKALSKELQKNGVEYKDAAKFMAESKAIDEWFRNKILLECQVNEAEALLYYTENTQSFTMKNRVKFSQVFIGFFQLDEKKLARKKIAEANYELSIGKDFSKVAQKFSQGTFAAKGGVQNRYYTEDDLIEELKPIMSLNVGQKTNVVESNSGFHIIKVLDKRKAGVPEFSEIKKGLILTMSMQKAKSLMSQKVEQRKKELGYKILIGQ